MRERVGGSPAAKPAPICVATLTSPKQTKHSTLSETKTTMNIQIHIQYKALYRTCDSLHLSNFIQSLSLSSSNNSLPLVLFNVCHMSLSLSFSLTCGCSLRSSPSPRGSAGSCVCWRRPESRCLAVLAACAD